MTPPSGKDNWALANFVESFDDWKEQLRRAVDWPVSLVATGTGFEMESEIRATGICLWRREEV